MEDYLVWVMSLWLGMIMMCVWGLTLRKRIETLENLNEQNNN